MKKILIAADTPTHPIIGGNRMCIVKNAQLLEDSGYEVYFVLLNNGCIADSELDATRKYWGDKYFEYNVSFVRKTYTKVVDRYFPSETKDIDHYCPGEFVKYVNKLHNSYSFSGLLVNYIWLSRLAYTDIPHKALYTHDVFSNRADRIAAEYKWMSFSPNQESKALQRFKNILAIQNNEAVFFSYLAPMSNIVPIYTPMYYVEQSIVSNHDVLFFSGGGELNLLGIKKYLVDVHPYVTGQMPDYRLIIGGNICAYLDSYELPDNVVLKGRYDNPSEFYASGNIVINPIYSGTGLKIKTLEAIAHGKVIITHPHSCEGLYDAVSVPVVSTSDAQQFGDHILSAIDDNTFLFSQRADCRQYIDSINRYIAAQYKSIYNDL